MVQIRYEQLPPYGLMYRDFQAGSDPDRAPADWGVRGTPAQPWNDWFTSTVATIAKCIWPEYQPGSGWTGDARDGAVALTEAELPLIIQFREAHFRRRAGGRGLADVRGAALFQQEDEGGWEKTLAHYCPELAAAQEAMLTTINAAVERKSGVVDLQLKARFQRPRPWQAAMILGQQDTFSYLLAKSAVTPSLVSGHGLQGLFAGCNVREALLRHDGALAGACEAGVAAWMTDIGDRRVMAGVHYPTDSIASWVVALRLAPIVFEEPGTPAFLRKAIRQSRLYTFLEERSKWDPALGQAMSEAWGCALEALKEP